MPNPNQAPEPTKQQKEVLEKFLDGVPVTEAEDVVKERTQVLQESERRRPK